MRFDGWSDDRGARASQAAPGFRPYRERARAGDMPAIPPTRSSRVHPWPSAALRAARPTSLWGTGPVGSAWHFQCVLTSGRHICNMQQPESGWPSLPARASAVVLKIEVQLKSRVVVCQVRMGDCAAEVAERFCTVHNLPKSAAPTIQQTIEQQQQQQQSAGQQAAPSPESASEPHTPSPDDQASSGAGQRGVGEATISPSGSSAPAASRNLNDVVCIQDKSGMIGMRQ